MRGYQNKREGDAILAEFPGLTQGELEWADKLFTPRIFYAPQGRHRRIWTGCCHREEDLEDALRLETPELYALRRALHGNSVRCPWCGRRAEVSAINKLRSGRTVEEFHPVVFFRASEDGETVWAQGYWTTRDYLSDPAGPTLYAPTRAYRFRRGEALQWDCGWSGAYLQKRKGGFLQEPFKRNGLYSENEAYRVSGHQELNDSFLRYSQWDIPVGAGEEYQWEKKRTRTTLLRYLGVAARYPEQVEMLRKAGMEDVLRDWVYRERKNADVIRWGERDPRKAFRLTKTELKEFLETDRSTETLRYYKAMDKELPVARCAVVGRILGLDRLKRAGKWGKTHGVSWHRIVGYLERQAKTNRSLHRSATLWLDYLEAAEALGYDLSNPLILMPGNLEVKHDEAAANRRVLLDREASRLATERQETLQKKYGFEDEDFLIRAPFDAEEIAQEGKSLRHCVGGYAERHAKGVTAILFLRKKAEPWTPYVTIEMHGTRLAQIHGYENDKNGVSPEVTHRVLLDQWLAWVKAGSKRDKEGRPKLPAKKGAA